jgi:hypothetical protein
MGTLKVAISIIFEGLVWFGNKESGGCVDTWYAITKMRKEKIKSQN